MVSRQRAATTEDVKKVAVTQQQLVPVEYSTVSTCQSNVTRQRSLTEASGVVCQRSATEAARPSCQRSALEVLDEVQGRVATEEDPVVIWTPDSLNTERPFQSATTTSEVTETLPTDTVATACNQRHQYGPPSGVRREARQRPQTQASRSTNSSFPAKRGSSSVPAPPIACPRKLLKDEGLADNDLVADLVLRTPDPPEVGRVLRRSPSPLQQRRSLPVSLTQRGKTAAEEIIGIWEEDMGSSEQAAEGQCIDNINLKQSPHHCFREDAGRTDAALAWALDEVQRQIQSVERMCSAPARLSFGANTGISMGSAGIDTTSVVLCSVESECHTASQGEPGVVIWSPASGGSNTTSMPSESGDTASSLELEGDCLEEVVSLQLQTCFDRIVVKAQQLQAGHVLESQGCEQVDSLSASKKQTTSGVSAGPVFCQPEEEPLPDVMTMHRPPTTIGVPIHEERSLDCTLEVTFLVPAGDNGKDFMLDLHNAFDSSANTSEDCVLVPCGGSRTALVMLRSLGPCEAIHHVKRWASEAKKPSCARHIAPGKDRVEAADGTFALPRAVVYVVQRQHCVDGTEQQLGPICSLEASYAIAKVDHQPCRFMAALHERSEMFVRASEAEVPGPVGAEFLRQLEQRGVQQLPCTAVIKGDMASHRALLVYIVETLVSQQDLNNAPVTDCSAGMDCRMSERMTSTPTSRRSLHTSTSQSSLPTLGSSLASSSRTSSSMIVSDSNRSFVLVSIGQE